MGQGQRRPAGTLGTMVVVQRISTTEKWRRKKYRGERRAASASVRRRRSKLPSRVTGRRRAPPRTEGPEGNRHLRTLAEQTPSLLCHCHPPCPQRQAGRGSRERAQTEGSGKDGGSGGSRKGGNGPQEHPSDQEWDGPAPWLLASPSQKTPLGGKKVSEGGEGQRRMADPPGSWELARHQDVHPLTQVLGFGGDELGQAEQFPLRNWWRTWAEKWVHRQNK